MEKYDFKGWASKNNLLCTDGRVIMEDAFKHNDGTIVPLVWNHQHDAPEKILGHALLQNRPEGVLTYGLFNNTESGKTAKLLVKHGDIVALSIMANRLKQDGNKVLHGDIKEVSLVLAGANPGAFINSVIEHGDYNMDDCVFLCVEEPLELSHFDEAEETVDTEEEHNDGTSTDNDESASNEEETIEHADDNKTETTEESSGEEDSETAADILDSLSDKQKDVVYDMLASAIEMNESDLEDNETEESEGGNEEMKHNVFDQQENNNEQKNVLTHEAAEAIITNAKRFGSMKESFLQHADTYGIDHIDYLFPDAKTVTNTPTFIKRDMGWVAKLMGGFSRSPFSRIKSVFADITEEEARAKGYIKGKLKKEEVFSLLKRSTTPTTVYKKQKMDREDVVDITDFDVITWLKAEMRLMLDEEIARAALVGDGRLASSDDKINEQCIRPIWKDNDLFTIKSVINRSVSSTPDDVAKAAIRNVIKSRKDYRGSGNPVLFTTEDNLTDMLLLTDETGRDLYENEEKLRIKLRVSDIVTVPVMENLTRSVDGQTHTLWGIVVNPYDYRIGADKGGAINMFDDFDIDYNQQKYLIETRCSGALTMPFSAIAIETKTQA